MALRGLVFGAFAGLQKIMQQHIAVDDGAVRVVELRVPLRGRNVAFAGGMAVNGLRNVVGHAPGLDRKLRCHLLDTLVVDAVDPGHVGVGVQLGQS